MRQKKKNTLSRLQNISFLFCLLRVSRAVISVFSIYTRIFSVFSENVALLPTIVIT